MPAAAKHAALVALSVVALGTATLAGAAGTSTSAKRDRTPPSPPSNLHVSESTPTSVFAEWDASVDNVGVAGYYVYGDTGRATVTSLGYLVRSLDCGESTSLSVSAFDRAGNRSERAVAAVSTAACPDTQPPTTPTGFQQSATAQNAVVLSWSPSSDDRGVVSYGVRRDFVQVASPTEPVVTLSGLSCGSTYSYLVDAADAAGNRSPLATAYVQTAACGDSQPPSPPADLRVDSRTPTSLSMSWTASTDDTAVAGYRVLLGGAPITTVAQAGVTLTGLACGASHTVGVDAYDGAGNQSAATSVEAATESCPPPPPDTTAPSAPTGLSAANVSPTSLDLSWSPSTDDVGVAGYDIYRNAGKVGSTATTSAGQTGLACGTAYAFTIVARDAAGNASPSSAALTVSTASCSAPPPPPADTTPPTQPANLAIASSSRTGVTLTWGAASDNVGVAGYRTYTNGSPGTTTTGSSSTISGLVCGTAYTFGVDAFDAAGNRSSAATVIGSTAACPDTQTPTAPINVVTTARTATSIALSWTASSDNVGVVGYGTYVGGALSGSTGGTTAIFSGLTCNRSYTLAVDAVDAAGNRSAQTAVLASTTACPDTTAPSTPTGLSASGVGQTGLTLSWNAATDNVGVTGYDVYRDGSKVASPTTVSVTQSGLSCGTGYAFGVAALDAAGNASPQAQLSVSTSACPAPPPPPPSSTLPCGSSLDAAYDAAQPGTTIELQDCTYTGLTITGSKTSPVVFDLNGGSIGGNLTPRATNLEVRNGSVGFVSWEGGTAPSNLTLRNLKMQGWIMEGGSNIQVLGGELGPHASDQLNWIYSDSASSPIRNVLIDGLYVHDNSCVSSGCHYEAIRVDRNVDGLTIRNSTFRKNAIFHVFISFFDPSGDGVMPKNLTFENNVFDVPLYGSSAIAIHDPVLTSVDPAILRITVRRNVASQGANYRGPFMVYENNSFGPAPACGDRVDNDSDGSVDYYYDQSCAAATSTSES